MTRAAIGIRAHSGWGVVVAASLSGGAVELLDRRRIAITEPDTAGASQPYHFAKSMQLAEAERYLAECAAASERLAAAAVGELVEELRQRGYGTAGCAILLASGRALPELPLILASHALIHTAEGEFFRRAFWKASERLGVGVTGIRERELDERAEERFGSGTRPLRRRIAEMGGTLGPPWTTDQKTAMLAAVVVLGDGS